MTNKLPTLSSIYTRTGDINLNKLLLYLDCQPSGPMFSPENKIYKLLWKAKGLAEEYYGRKKNDLIL